jgi:hypothetical protein
MQQPTATMEGGHHVGTPVQYSAIPPPNYAYGSPQQASPQSPAHQYAPQPQYGSAPPSPGVVPYNTQPQYGSAPGQFYGVQPQQHHPGSPSLQETQMMNNHQMMMQQQMMHQQSMQMMAMRPSQGSNGAPASPIIVNNNNSGGGGGGAVVFIQPKPPVNHCCHCCLTFWTVGAWLPCWISACVCGVPHC